MKISNFSTLLTYEDLRSEVEHSRSYLADYSWILMEDETSTTRVLIFFKKKFLRVSLGSRVNFDDGSPARSPAGSFLLSSFSLNFLSYSSLFQVLRGKFSRPL